MNIHVHKNRATSRRLGQRCDIPESYIFNVATFRGSTSNIVTRSEDQASNIAMLRSNITTLQRVKISTS